MTLRARWPAGKDPTRHFMRDSHGAAAVELALWLVLLVVPLLSTVDLGYYAYQKMQVQIAGQAAVQAAWHACDVSKLPATKNCPNLSSIMTAAAQGTTLGTGVTISTTTPITEGYYCSDSNKALKVIGSTGTTSAPLTATVPNCTTVDATNTSAAGDYISATVSFNYQPAFTGLSIGALLTSPITHTAWMRLN